MTLQKKYVFWIRLGLGILIVIFLLNDQFEKKGIMIRRMLIKMGPSRFTIIKGGEELLNSGPANQNPGRIYTPGSKILCLYSLIRFRMTMRRTTLSSRN